MARGVAATVDRRRPYPRVGDGHGTRSGFHDRGTASRV